MLRLPLAPQFVLGPITLVILSVLLWWFEPNSFNWLAFSRSKIESFELWRLVTGNLVHSNTSHLLLNLGGLLVIWGLYGDYCRSGQFLILALLCSLGVTLGIFFLAPERINYVGLSGVLHGLFAWGAYRDITKGFKTGWLLILGLGIKITFEQIFGGSHEIEALIGTNIATESHLYGAICGLILAPIYPILKKQ